jgi:hypothetical protein
MQFLRLTSLLLGCQALVLAAFAQTLPLELRQELTGYNLQSTNGVPLSHLVGNPPGSNGKAENPAISGLVGTTNQFQSLTAFGGGVVPKINTEWNSSQNYAANAINLNLPRNFANADNRIVMARARVGAPFIGQSPSIFFGGVLPPPETDEYGVLLSVVNTNTGRAITTPTDYWFAEPYHGNQHAGAKYYWSAHALSVFATSPGPVQVVWRRTNPGGLTGSPNNAGTITVGGTAYVIYTNNYVVSGTAVKTPRKMYWSHDDFLATGKPVLVPSARVGDIHIAFNTAFPERVSAGEAYKKPPANELEPYTELRTLWYERGLINAYNKEGRVFVEVLGDLRPNGTRRHLGFEIVDVIKEENPADVTVELGELLTAYPGGLPSDEDLFPEPISKVELPFIHRHNITGRARPEYYAIRETFAENQVLVHWMEAGVEDLLWPFRYVRYKQVWPDDVQKYSHYVRPTVATEQEARATGVRLPAENAPLIAFQDSIGGTPRAALTERFEFYTFLDAQAPAHRTLLQFSIGGNIAFERVFSWLDQRLVNTNFAGTVATNLSSFNRQTSTFNWPPGTKAPRYLARPASVGDRIERPSEEGSDEPLAGYIR